VNTLPIIRNSIIIAGLCITSISSIAAETTPAKPSTTAATATTAPTTNAASFSAEQKTQIEQIIHDYLVTKPEVLIEASKALQEKQVADAASKAKEAITKNASSLFSTNNVPKFGNANGDVTIVEFLDYQCGHCKTMSPIISDLVKSDSKVQVVIRGLPIFGDASKTATKAVIASTKQGTEKFVKFNEALLSTNQPLNDKTVYEIAKKSGLDVNKLKKDMASKEVDTQMDENFRLARLIGLMGTPAFLLANRDLSKTEFLPGAATKEDLSALIAKLR